jgi:hypothetical protein
MRRWRRGCFCTRLGGRGVRGDGMSIWNLAMTAPLAQARHRSRLCILMARCELLPSRDYKERSKVVGFRNTCSDLT